MLEAFSVFLWDIYFLENRRVYSIAEGFYCVTCDEVGKRRSICLKWAASVSGGKESKAHI